MASRGTAPRHAWSESDIMIKRRYQREILEEH